MYLYIDFNCLLCLFEGALKQEKPAGNFKIKYLFSTHMANSAAESVWRGKTANILDYHKAQPRGEGYLRPPQKQKFRESSHSSESEPEEKRPAPRQRSISVSRGRGHRGRGRRGRGMARGRGGATSLRRSRRLAKTGRSGKDSSYIVDQDHSNDEDEEEEELDEEEGSEGMAEETNNMQTTRPGTRKRRNSARSTQDSSVSSEESSEEEDNIGGERPVKQPRYSIQHAVQSSPLSSPRSDVSCEESPEPFTEKHPPSDQSHTAGVKKPSEQVEKSSPTVGDPHRTPLSIHTPESTNTPAHQQSMEENNYTITHGTPETTPTVDAAAAAASQRQDCMKEGGDGRGEQHPLQEQQSRMDQQSRGVHTGVTLPQASEMTHGAAGDKNLGVYSSQGWGMPMSHQFMQGGYPYNPKMHPMATYHTPQGMVPGNYPYSVPYPWPHPPQSSQHPNPEQMRGAASSYPHSLSPHGSASAIPPTAASATAWCQQQQPSKGLDSSSSKKPDSAGKASAPSYYDPKPPQASSQQQQQQQKIEHLQQQQHHGIQHAPNPNMQYRYQPQPAQVEGPTAAFQYGFDSRHPSLAAAHMWQSPQVQHHQLHPLMSHHFASQGLWYAQNPQQSPQQQQQQQQHAHHQQMAMLHPGVGESREKSRKMGGDSASTKLHRPDMNMNNNNNNNNNNNSVIEGIIASPPSTPDMPTP